MKKWSGRRQPTEAANVAAEMKGFIDPEVARYKEAIAQGVEFLTGEPKAEGEKVHVQLIKAYRLDGQLKKSLKAANDAMEQCPHSPEVKKQKVLTLQAMKKEKISITGADESFLKLNKSLLAGQPALPGH